MVYVFETRSTYHIDTVLGIQYLISDPGRILKESQEATMLSPAPRHQARGQIRGQNAAKNVAEMQDMLDNYTQGLKSAGSRDGCDLEAVAVVGTTGFLGPYIVASLLKRHTKLRIFCLNRRTDGYERTLAALERIFGGELYVFRDRLRFFVVDTTKPFLGLDNAQATMLISELGELIFNAWDPNWGKPLPYFDPFLKGLRNSIDLCVSFGRGTGITFISSICAVGDWPLVHPNQPRVPEEVIWDNRCAMPHGYGESKCVAEQLLAIAHEVSGLRVSIVRAGQIGGPARGTVKTWPRQGWILSLLHKSDKLGYFPAQVQPLDWIPVDCLADGIASSMKTQVGAASLRVYNMVHPRPASWSLLSNLLKKRFGFSWSMIELSAWLQKMNAEDFRLHRFLGASNNGRELNMSFHNTNALVALSEVVSINEDLLAQWFQGWGLRPSHSKAKL